MSGNKGVVGHIASSIQQNMSKTNGLLPKSQQTLNGFVCKEILVPTGSSQRVRKRKMVRKKKVVDESPLSVLCAWVVEHQIGMLLCLYLYIRDTNHTLGLSLNLLLLLSLTHFFFSRARPYTRLFLEMSYFNPTKKNYTQGWEDLYFVVTWIIVITGLRVAVMDYVLKPIARYGGVNKAKAQTRFAEQGWLFCYYVVFSPLGMVCASLLHGPVSLGTNQSFSIRHLELSINAS